MTIRIDATLEHLRTIAALAKAWPTDDEILHDTRHGIQPPVKASPDPERLPHGLDRLLNTETRTRTRTGAVTKLRRVWHLWGNPKPELAVWKQGDEYATLCSALILRLARNENTDAEQFTQGQDIIARLARDTAKATGAAGEPLPFRCPACEGDKLARPSTSHGLLEMAVCDDCGGYWTFGQLDAIARGGALFATVDADVTIAEAAGLLGADLKTIYARASRRKAEPVGWRGGRRTYRLADLR